MYKGVSWAERSGKWRAQLWMDGKARVLLFALLMLPLPFQAEFCTLCLAQRPCQLLFVAASRRTFPRRMVQTGALVRDTPCQPHRAASCVRRQVRHLGFFEDEVEAARAYDHSVLELKGAGAATNFPAADALSASACARPPSRGAPCQPDVGAEEAAVGKLPR
jgi:hypothetical protein